MQHGHKRYREDVKGQKTMFAYRLKTRFNITVEDYNLLLEKQNNSCAICERKEPTGRGGWHIDHCHKTLKVRGLLCNKCNSGLGLFEDNPDVMAKAREYLLK